MAQNRAKAAGANRLITTIHGDRVKEDRMVTARECLNSQSADLGISAGGTPLGGASTPTLPTVLADSRRQEFLRGFLEEYQPVGATEHVLVADLAQHAAGGERWEEGGGAVEREAARRMPHLEGDVSLKKAADYMLIAALTTAAAETCERHGMLRARAFLRTHDKLLAVQAARRERERRGRQIPPFDFVDELACETYLAERLRRGLVPCADCGGVAGYVISSRKCWECGRCKAQAGLRSNTVMARSAVPLRTWFDAVRRVLWRPTIGAAELAEKVGIKRVATAHAMIAKIRGAMAADNASERLAGLDSYFARVAT